MNVLSQGKFPPVTHVIHLADTHVRTGDRVTARAEEYRHVFANLYKNVQRMGCVKKGTALMVIAGDVFHHKGRLETEGALVIYEWLNQILQLLPVLIICGNHDFRQEDPNYTDMISMLVTPYTNSGYKYPIHYLQETGHYLWENLGFGLTTVKDTLKAYNTCGILAELPKFPDPTVFDDRVSCRMALFHGSVIQSALPNGAQVADYAHGYALEWFRGYDIALLGDNHTQQVQLGLDDTLAWGYPGSLIQQDGGEPLFGHGYILWDVQTRKGTAYHVRNDYGTVNVTRTKNGDLVARLRPRDMVPLEEAKRLPKFPKQPQIRVLGVMGDDALVERELAKLEIQPSRMYLSKCSWMGGEDGGENGDEGEQRQKMAGRIQQLSDLNSPEKWKVFVEQKAPEMNEEVKGWLFHPEGLLLQELGLPEVLTEKITKRNASIQAAIDLYKGKIQETLQPRYEILLRHMEWEYLMCYGKGNWFDFSRMDGNVALLNGRNASGKSSFLDVICLAIFGDATTMRSDIHGSKTSFKIIHDKKPPGSKHDSAYVRLLFSVDGVLYEVKRSFTMKQKDGVLQTRDNKVATVHRIQEGVMVLVADGNNMVHRWMTERFGTLPEMLMSTILCQSDNSNFFLQKAEQQVYILEKALHMDTIHGFECLLHEASKAYKYALQEVTTYLRGLSDGGCYQGGAEEVQKRLEELAQKKGDLARQVATKTARTEEAHQILIQIQGGVDDYGYDLGEAEEGLRQEQERRSSFPDLTPEVLAKAHQVRERLERLHQELEGLPRMSDAPEVNVIQQGLAKVEKSIANHAKRCPEDEPSITEAYIEEKEHDYEAWQKTLRYMEITLHDLEDRRATLTKEQAKLYQQMEALDADRRRRAPRAKDGYAVWKKEWEAWSTLVAGISEMTVQELDQRATEICEYLQKIETARAEGNSVAERIQQRTEERAEYACVEFNEACAACQKNPLRKRLDTLTKELKSLEAKQKRLQKKLVGMEENDTGYKGELEDIRLARVDRVVYEARVEMMTREKEAWDRSAGMWEQEEQEEKQRKQVQADLRTIHEEMQALQKIRVEHEGWIRETEKIAAEKELLAEWKKWNEKQQELLEDKTRHENTLRWHQCQREIEENRALFSRIDAYEQAVRERDEWQNIVWSIQWKAVWKQVEEITAVCDREQAELAIQEATLQGALDKARRYEACQAAVGILQGRMTGVQRLLSVFVGEKGEVRSGFKAWVYQEQIVPLLQEEVNAFLAPLETFRLTIQYHQGALLYSLEDRGNRPTLDHASGYQRFLVGLAMRITLARIGAVGQNVRHLFLDEGFVACDSDNLRKVEDVLQSMREVGGYQSVLLMSHLDAIREVARIRIDIQRSEDNMFSKISWGNTYPVWERYKKMELVELADGAGTTKRGKPKKNT